MLEELGPAPAYVIPRRLVVSTVACAGQRGVGVRTA